MLTALLHRGQGKRRRSDAGRNGLGALVESDGLPAAPLPHRPRVEAKRGCNPIHGGRKLKAHVALFAAAKTVVVPEPAHHKAHAALKNVALGLERPHADREAGVLHILKSKASK